MAKTPIITYVGNQAVSIWTNGKAKAHSSGVFTTTQSVVVMDSWKTALELAGAVTNPKSVMLAAIPLDVYVNKVDVHSIMSNYTDDATAVSLYLNLIKDPVLGAAPTLDTFGADMGLPLIDSVKVTDLRPVAADHIAMNCLTMLSPTSLVNRPDMTLRGSLKKLFVGQGAVLEAIDQSTYAAIVVAMVTAHDASGLPTDELDGFVVRMSTMGEDALMGQNVNCVYNCGAKEWNKLS